MIRGTGKYIDGGIAGSLPLFLFMRDILRLDKEALFEPGDADIWITNRNEKEVDWIIKEFQIGLAREGVRVKSIIDSNEYRQELPEYASWAALADYLPRIVNVHLLYHSFKISFIAVPKAKTMLEVTDRFDIDICQMIYNFKTGSFLYDDFVRQSIEQRSATVADFLFQSAVPSKAEVFAYENTLNRMRKYASRGFSFKTLPKIQVLADFLPETKRAFNDNTNYS